MTFFIYTPKLDEPATIEWHQMTHYMKESNINAGYKLKI